jgi:hypothetical protein
MCGLANSALKNERNCLPGPTAASGQGSASPFPDHKSNCYVWEKEQNEYRRLGHEPARIVNDVKLLSGYWNNLGVNTVCKIPPERQRTQPEEEHKYAHDKTPD